MAGWRGLEMGCCLRERRRVGRWLGHEDLVFGNRGRGGSGGGNEGGFGVDVLVAPGRGGTAARDFDEGRTFGRWRVGFEHGRGFAMDRGMAEDDACGGRIALSLHGVAEV